MQLGTVKKTYQTENQSWLYSHDGAKGAKPATLNISLFTKATHFPNGYLPSGLELGRVTASGLYGPFDPAASDGRQNLAGYLFTAVPLRDETANAIGALLDGTGTPTIVLAKLPIATKLTTVTRETLGRRFIFEG